MSNVSNASGIGKDRVKEGGCAIESQSKSSLNSPDQEDGISLAREREKGELWP